MRARLIGEPELEFRARNRHIDPRYGLAVFGPADADSPSAPRDITVGIVGPAGAIDGLRAWLEWCQTRIEAKDRATVGARKILLRTTPTSSAKKQISPVGHAPAAAPWLWSVRRRAQGMARELLPRRA